MGDHPPVLWRISNYHTLTGEGGRRFAARWHSAGSRVVYLAASPAGALIEVLVHLEMDETELPAHYTLLKVVVAAEAEIETLECSGVADWRQRIELPRALGDEWLRSLRTPLARVPSAVMPETWNYLLNPEQRDARLVQIADVHRELLDPRLFRRKVVQ